MSPFFSIIIPVYNVAQCLRECLDSVLAQTFADSEAICVDDGSTDGSATILDEYASKDARIKIIHQANSGVSVARNRGLTTATGEWVSFVDSDDVVTGDYLESFASLEKKGDITFFPIMYKWVTGERLTAGIEEPSYSEDCEINAKTVRRLVQNPTRHNIFAYMPNKFIRRSLIEENNIRFVEGLSLSEDEIFMFEVCRHVKSIALMKDPLYEYRCRHTGLSSRRNRPCEWLFDLYNKAGNNDNRNDIKRAAYLRAYMLGYEELVKSGSWRFCNKFLAFFRANREFMEGGMNWYSFIAMCAKLPLDTGILALFGRVGVKRLVKKLVG